jgi:hypothetical protein
VNGGDVVALLQQRLVSGQEVADRGLRGAGQRLGATQLLEVGRVVGDQVLALGAVGAEHHVQRNHRDRVALDPLGG